MSIEHLSYLMKTDILYAKSKSCHSEYSDKHTVVNTTMYAVKIIILIISWTLSTMKANLYLGSIKRFL